MIKKFQVSTQVRRFNAVSNTQTIFFTPWTIVVELPTELSSSLPCYIFNFVDFEDLDHKERNRNVLVSINPSCLFMFQVLLSIKQTLIV